MATERERLFGTDLKLLDLAPGLDLAERAGDVALARGKDRIRNGVERPESAAFRFRSAVTSYALPPAAVAVSRVTGLVSGQFREFQEGVHYRFSAGRVAWIHATERPDENSRVEVEFTVRE